jgi:hypothetical protein
MTFIKVFTICHSFMSVLKLLFHFAFWERSSRKSSCTIDYNYDRSVFEFHSQFYFLLLYLRECQIKFVKHLKYKMSPER